MKAKILFSLLLLSGFLSNGQGSFSIVNPTVEKSTVITEGGYEDLNAGILNNTDVGDTIYFQLIKADNPSDWRFSLCGSEKCYVPGPSSVSGKDFLKVSDKAQLFKLTWAPNSPGAGEVVYEVYSYKKPSEKQLVTFRMTATALTANIEKIDGFTAIYPNPCRDLLTVVTPDNSYNEVSISDLSGKVVLRQAIDELNTVISIGSLEKGSYLVTTKGKKLLRKTILID